MGYESAGVAVRRWGLGLVATLAIACATSKPAGAPAHETPSSASSSGANVMVKWSLPSDEKTKLRYFKVGSDLKALSINGDCPAERREGPLTIGDVNALAGKASAVVDEQGDASKLDIGENIEVDIGGKHRAAMVKDTAGPAYRAFRDALEALTPKLGPPSRWECDSN